MRLRASILLMALLVGALPSIAATVQSRSLTLADLGEEVGIGELDVAPDGRRIALVTSRADYVDNRYVKSLVLVESTSGATTQLAPNRQSVGAPQWSPSGDRLAYLDTESNGVTQLYVLSGINTDSQSVLRVTDAPRSVRDYRWSPDGASFAYLMADAAEANPAEERHNKSFLAGEGDYLETAPPAPAHLWLIAARGGEARRLTSGKQSVVELAWGAAGVITFVSQPSAYFVDFRNKSLNRIDVASGQQSVLVAAPTAVDHGSFHLASPDGRFVSYQYFPGPEPLFHPKRLALVSIAGGESSIVSKDLDRNVLSHAWTADSKSLVVVGVERTRPIAWLQSLEGASRALDLGSVTNVSSLVASRSGALSFVGSEPNKPAEVYFMAAPGATPKRLTAFNERFTRLSTGRVETLVWQGPDGFTLDGVVTYPPGFKKGNKAPLVLNLHGGPMFATPESWDSFSQLLAAQGWIVFQPNYRGSTSTGTALQTAIINDAGNGPGRDVMSGIAALQAKGIVDETRMAVSGWSYGGYMTAWLIGNYPVWRAAVTGATVTDWLDYYNLSDANVWAGYGLGGSPWRDDNAENYRRQSPIAYAHQAKTPTLILSNTGDRRVTISQSYKLYHALKDNGVEVEFVAYPVNAHVPIDPVHERDIRRRWIGWIEKHF
jgi:dipeptidyl aminopeptidase/acylaminoacyl peptidase